jgi:hypothetical protein
LFGGFTGLHNGGFAAKIQGFSRRPDTGTAGLFSCRSISVSLCTAAGKMFIAMAFIGNPLVRPARTGAFSFPALTPAA